MRNWKSVAHRLAVRLERRVDAVRAGWREEQGRVVEIHPFRGYGTTTKLHVLGRVLRQPRIALAADHGTAWSNLLESFRRLASEEVAAAEVIATIGEISIPSKTDGEGYFHIEIARAADEAEGTTWVPVHVRAVATPSKGDVVTEVMVPGRAARFGVISDIDDTIVETNAVSLLRMARTVFMQNARGRMATPGIAALYRALQRGVSGAESNPFFYVSSSPWNFYDLLDQFLALNDIPPGPLMLQDYGLDEVKLIHTSHDDHKLAQIREIVGTYPGLPFVLIGDSGQRDPEIYLAAVHSFPGRIRAVYIRDVTLPARDAEVRAIAEAVASTGVHVAFFTNVHEAMDHARGIGLIG